MSKKKSNRKPPKGVVKPPKKVRCYFCWGEIEPSGKCGTLGCRNFQR